MRLFISNNNNNTRPPTTTTTMGGLHTTPPPTTKLLLLLLLTTVATSSFAPPNSNDIDEVVEAPRDLASDIDVNYSPARDGGERRDGVVEEDAEEINIENNDSEIAAPVMRSEEEGKGYGGAGLPEEKAAWKTRGNVSENWNKKKIPTGNWKPKPQFVRKANGGGGGFPAGGDGAIRRMFGVADAVAVAGHYFHLKIPDDAFQGRVQYYTVTGLPDWLQFNSTSNTIVGVAGTITHHHHHHQQDHHNAGGPANNNNNNSNGFHYVTVTAHAAAGSSDTTATDTFALTVVRRPSVSEQRQQVSGCQHTSSPLLRLSVHLPVLWHQVTPVQRADAITGLARVTGLDVQMVSLVPAAVVVVGDPSTDSAALLTATLLHDNYRTTGPGMQLRVMVGCGNHISLRRAVARVQVAANNTDTPTSSNNNNKLSRAIGLPVFGYKVAPVDVSAAVPTRQQQHDKRDKRSPDYEASDYPVYDYNDYEYDDYDPNYSGLEYDEPEERVVPSLATPIFTGGPSTAAPTDGTHPRRGHGGRQPVLPPVLRPVPLSTPINVPVKPTRVVVEPSPTVQYRPEAATRYNPTERPPQQPSIMVEPTRPLAPETSVTPTEALPRPPPSSSSGGSRYTPPTTTEVVDHLVRNFRPDVINRIEKLAWVAGFVYRLKIPVNTFADLEDGNTTHLRLLLRESNGNTLGTQSWIQFDPASQEIYALPLEDHIGFYTYLLEAIDSGGKSVTETVKIQVQQPQQGRNYNHRFTATLRIAKKYAYDFTFSLDWQIRVVQKIVQLFDNNTRNINIRSISENPTKVVWTNLTLVDTQSTTCPTHQLDYINQVLFGTLEDAASNELLKEVVDSFKPEFHLKKIHAHYSPPCDNYPDASTTASPRNKHPLFINQVDIVRATAGTMYRKQVPPDACYDFEEGEGRKLRMRLLTSSLERLPLDSWLQFDTNNQEFYGLPLKEDVGTVEYTLKCVDSKGGKINDALTVVVEESPYSMSGANNPPLVISLTFDHEYTALMNQPMHKALLMKMLGTAFGDPDSRFISVESIAPGSTVITFYNTSLPSDGGCPGDAIQQLHDIMLAPDGNLQQSFISHFSPEFTLIDGGLSPGGVCFSPDTPSHIPPLDVGRPDHEGDHTHEGDAEFGFDDIRGRESVSGEQSQDESFLLTFLVPSVLMAAMLVLAAVAACCLYRHRRRYAKMSLTNHATPPDTTTFVTTGIPVILAEELDDHQALTSSRQPLAKTPIIMKEEKPPLPPYRQSPPPGANNQPASRRLLDQPGYQQQSQPYQQPPPPFTTNGRSNNSPRNTMQSQPPAYRKPTYMPP